MRVMLACLALLVAACDPEASSDPDAGVTCASTALICGDSICVETPQGPACAVQACSCSAAIQPCIEKRCDGDTHCESRGSLPLVCVPNRDGG